MAILGAHCLVQVLKIRKLATLSAPGAACAAAGEAKHARLCTFFFLGWWKVLLGNEARQMPNKMETTPPQNSRFNSWQICKHCNCLIFFF